MKLKVYLENALVGELSNDPQTNLFAFDYAHEWRTNRQAFGLSPRLALEAPNQAGPELRSADVKNFFENLLPEGQGLDVVSVLHQVSKSNLMGLLSHVGSDLAGGLRIDFAQRSVQVQPIVRPLLHGELSQRIKDRPQQPFSV